MWASALLFYEGVGFEPEEEGVGPGVGVFERGFVGEADAVVAVLVDVEVEGDAGALESGGEFEAVLDFDRFVFPSVPDEAGRSVGGDLSFVRKEFDQAGRWIRPEEVVSGTSMRVRAHG